MKKMETNLYLGKRNKLFFTLLAVTAVLAVPHGMDTYGGALESGDWWLMGRYLLLALSAFLTAAMAGLGLLGIREGKPFPLERIYPAAVLIFGVLYLVVLPPLSAPDEVRHYISAYQISNRILGLPATGEDGKVPVRQEDWFVEDSTGEFDPYVTASGYLATDEDGADGAKVLGQVLTEETYRLIYEKGPRNWEPLRGDHAGQMALSNHHPVETIPTVYVISALGITLARLLGLNSLWLLYLGRLANLLFFTVVTWLAMKRLPFGKTVLFGVTMLPMTLHLAASFSYDSFVLAALFYFTAICLDLAYKAERVRLLDLALLALLMAAAGPCKMIYTVWMGLCLLIPIRKFGGVKFWILSAAGVFCAWLIAMVLVNGQTVASYATEVENYISWAQEAGYSLSMLLHSPVRTLRLFYDTLIWQGEHYHLTMIGAYLGNVDLVLDVPYVVVMAFSGGLLGLAFRKPGEKLVIKGRQRVWIWFLCLLCAGMALLSMLLAWTPVSSRVINGVQGRYFLPFLPILLISLKNNVIVLTKDSDRSILYLMCCMDAFVLMRLFGIVSMRL